MCKISGWLLLAGNNHPFFLHIDFCKSTLYATQGNYSVLFGNNFYPSALQLNKILDFGN